MRDLRIRLRPLANPRHEKFAREYLRLGVGRHAYVAAGYQAKTVPQDNAPADVCASRLLRDARVQARLEGLRAMASKRHDVTEDTLLAELEEARQSALGNAQSGAAVQATMGKARITGHIIERKESGQPGDFDRMNEQELRAWIAEHKPLLEQQAIASADSGNVRLNGENVGDSSSDTTAPVKRQTHDGTDTTQ